MGVVKGANLGAATSIVLIGTHATSMATSAFLGGLVALLAVLFLVRLTRMTHTAVYILAGIVISAVADSLIMLLKFFADPEQELAAMEFWAMGGFGDVTLDKVLPMLPLYALGLVALVLLRRQVALLSMSEEESQTLGVRVGPVRLVILGATTLLVASVISVVGRVAFLGLISPHIARLAMGRTRFSTSVLSGLVATAILLFADCGARVVYEVELPISIVTTAVGVPCLLFFLYRRKEGRL